MIDRRALLTRSSLLAAAGALPACAPMTRTDGAPAGNSLPAFYADIEERTFRWFWDNVNRKNGLVPDRWPTPSFCSIASVGFGLTAYPIGVERGWCTRAEARDLTLTTLRFFWNAPQGPEPTGKTGHKGFFYHFIDMKTGERFRDVELSSVDTTLLLMGVLFAGRYYDRDEPAEAEIRKLAHAIYARADWNFFRSDGRKPVSMGWHPERGLIRQAGSAIMKACSSMCWGSARPNTRCRRTAGKRGPRITHAAGAAKDRLAISPSRLCSATSTARSGSTIAASRTR
jgi:hypothetical protein